MAVTKQQSALAKALQALKSLQDEHAVAVLHGSEVLGADNTKVLVENGFLEQVIKGWYIPSNPSHAGTTVTWYASYWAFVSAYCTSRFGEDWCLTPEESLCVVSGETVIPRQVVVRVRKGSNTVQSLLHGTSIFNLTAKLPPRIEKDPTYGLNIYPLAEALLRCSPDFYLNHPTEIRACLNALSGDENLAAAVRDVGGESYAGRLIGALKAVGRLEVAEFVRRVLKDLGRRVDESNPFLRTFERVSLPDRSPVAARLRLFWSDMRQQMLNILPPLARQPVLRPLAPQSSNNAKRRSSCGSAVISGAKQPKERNAAMGNILKSHVECTCEEFVAEVAGRRRKPFLDALKSTFKTIVLGKSTLVKDMSSFLRTMKRDGRRAVVRVKDERRDVFGDGRTVGEALADVPFVKAHLKTYRGDRLAEVRCRVGHVPSAPTGVSESLGWFSRAQKIFIAQCLLWFEDLRDNLSRSFTG